MRQTLCFFVFLSLSLLLKGQSLEWATSYGSSGNDSGTRIVCDNSGSSYTIGSITSGNKDFFIRKLSSDGNIMWSYILGNSIKNDYALEIAIDTLGSIYVAGNFEQSIDVDPGSGTHLLVSNGYVDGFLIKLDSAGNLIWSLGIGGASGDVINTVSVDSLGFIYLGGSFQGTVDFNPGSTPELISSTGTQSNSFFQKRDLDGNLIWTKTISATTCYNSEADNFGNIYFTGSFFQTVDFDPGSGLFNLTSTHAGAGADPGYYILKLNPDGEFKWAYQIECTGEIRIYGISNSLYGDLLVTGTFEGTYQDFDSGPGVCMLSSFYNTTDCFIMCLDSAGSFKWAHALGNSGIYERGLCVDTDQYGNVVWGGYINGIVDFDPGPAYLDLGIVSSGFCFIQLLDSSGNHIWSTAYGYLYSATSTVSGIIFDSNGDILATGACYQGIDFDSGPDTTYLPNAGSSDAFILKLSPQSLSTCQDISVIDSITACSEYTWINGITYTASNYADVSVLSSVEGCDSIVHLNLLIKNVDPGVTFLNPGMYANSVGASYQWVDCNDNYSPIFGETTQTFIPSYIGNFAVVVTKNGCTDTSSCYSVTTLAGLDDLNTSPKPTVYPNPVIDKLTISFFQNMENCRIYIQDPLGKTIRSYPNFSGNQLEIYRDGLASGIYSLLFVLEDEKTYSIKVILD